MTTRSRWCTLFVWSQSMEAQVSDGPDQTGQYPSGINRPEQKWFSEKEVEQMTTEVPNERIQIIVAAFSDEDAADLALDELQMAGADQGVAIQDAAVVRRDAHGVLHTNETNTWNK